MFYYGFIGGTTSAIEDVSLNELRNWLILVGPSFVEHVNWESLEIGGTVDRVIDSYRLFLAPMSKKSAVSIDDDLDPGFETKAPEPDPLLTEKSVQGLVELGADDQDQELPDITTMKADEAIDVIQGIADPDVLHLLAEAEESTKKRSTVLTAIKEQLGVD